MANESSASAESAKVNIQSKAHEKLLNIIDELRSQGINRFIDLPQLIVCGDQSSGKSSVLEAVSGLRFPVKDSLCTRFATELVLRRNPKVSSTVRIVPDTSRPDSEQKALLDFETESSVFDDFQTIIDEASEAMGLHGASVFSSHRLRVELTGPDQPHLTLVDLPGLFHAGSKSQSSSDKEAVIELVTTYMKNTRSVILAVVSAKNDFNNQIVTEYASEYDPGGERTLGIITKPDALPVGSESEKKFVNLAENEDVFLRLGWHVLRNRDYQEREFTSQERDALEEKFFNSGVWTSIAPANLGIKTLRPRLSRVLQDQILRELPGLIRDVESGIKSCEGRLGRLGQSRGTLREQRKHLHRVSEAFTTLLREAVDGSYHNEYFGSPSSEEGYKKRIRALIRNSLDNFAEDIRVKGHQYEVVKDAAPRKSKRPPFKVTEAERLEEVKNLIRCNRGRELAGSAKEETVTMLFQEQSSPWVDLARRHAKIIFEHVRTSVMLALDATCDRSTRDGVLSTIVNPALDQIRSSFDAAVKKTLKQHTAGVPATCNHYYIENVQQFRAQRSSEHLRQKLLDIFGKDPASVHDYITNQQRVNVKSLHQALTATVEADMTLFTCSEALHAMDAYYKVAMKNFVDDFGYYAVEDELMEKLPKILDPATVLELEDDLVEEIAGETEESKSERKSLKTKLESLQLALDALRRLDRGNTRNILNTARVSEPAVEEDEEDSEDEGKEDEVDEVGDE